jgi:hypothetical protein
MTRSLAVGWTTVEISQSTASAVRRPVRMRTMFIHPPISRSAGLKGRSDTDDIARRRLFRTAGLRPNKSLPRTPLHHEVASAAMEIMLLFHGNMNLLPAM